MMSFYSKTYLDSLSAGERGITLLELVAASQTEVSK